VQWFRAWADMLRWLEDFELKHVEFVRCIRYFESMHRAWTAMESSCPNSPGYAAFARRQSATFRALKEDAEVWFARAGAPRFVKLSGRSLAEELKAFRKQELEWLTVHIDEVCLL
jgi:hypothetical protein